MKGEEISETVDDLRHDIIGELISKHIPENAYAEQWDAAGLRERLREAVAVDFPMEDWAKEEGIADEEIRERVLKTTDDYYNSKREKFTPDIMQQVEKSVLLQTMDRLWREHIVAVEYLRQVIGLRSYGQRDPLNEYKTEGFTLFSEMVTNMKEAVTSQLMRIEIRMQGDDGLLPDETQLPPMQAHHIDATTGMDDVGEGAPVFGSFNQPVVSTGPIDPKKPETWGKVGRNDDCPCGSGKKYKHCHGAYA
jgi:preprotein translocase subunit SecA